MQNLRGVTEETLEMVKPVIKKSVTTTGITVGTGLQGYFLEEGAKLLRPVLSPIRNRIPRVKAPVGSVAANYRAITNINAGNSDPSVGFGYPGAVLQTTTTNVSVDFQVLSEGQSVLLDAQILAQNWDDLRAEAGTNLLYSLMIDEDKKLLGGQSFALQQPTGVAVVPSGTGGTIPASTTIYVAVVARGINGYWFGGSSVASAAVSGATSTGSTNSLSCTWNPVQGAAVYDVYTGPAATTLYYYGSTTTASIVVTNEISANNTLTNLPGLAPFTPPANIGTDSSANPNSINGIYPTIAGNYLNGSLVANGTAGATLSGAYIQDLGGSTLTGNGGTIEQIDSALISLWNQSQVSPTLIIMNAQQFKDAANHMLSTGGGRVLIPPQQTDVREGLVAGYNFISYLNPATPGQTIELMSEPHMPPGMIIGVSEVLPYPQSRVAQVLDVCTQLEYTQIEYQQSRVVGSPTGGPRYDFEVRAIEAFRNYFPAGCFALTGIAAG